MSPDKTPEELENEGALVLQLEQEARLAVIESASQGAIRIRRPKLAPLIDLLKKNILS